MGLDRIDHFELVVSDIDRALEFYRGLGLEVVQSVSPQGRTRSFLNVGKSQQINVVTPADVANLRRTAGPGGGHFCLVWEGAVEEVVEHFSQRGLAPRRGPGKGNGATGEGISIFINDPDQNSVEIIIYP